MLVIYYLMTTTIPDWIRENRAPTHEELIKDHNDRLLLDWNIVDMKVYANVKLMDGSTGLVITLIKSNGQRGTIHLPMSELKRLYEVREKFQFRARFINWIIHEYGFPTNFL